MTLQNYGGGHLEFYLVRFPLRTYFKPSSPLYCWVIP
jgi:hypothetical protein